MVESAIWRFLNLPEYTNAVDLIARGGKLTHIALGEVKSAAGKLVLIDGTMQLGFTKPEAAATTEFGMARLCLECRARLVDQGWRVQAALPDRQPFVYFGLAGFYES